MKLFKHIIAIVLCAVFFSACKKLDVFEKNASIPEYKWQYGFAPAFNFEISDTAASYNMYIVLRHTDAYAYNNIWLNIGSKAPADSAFKTQRFDVTLGDDTQGWYGRGMDDIWEVRVPITKGAIQFKKPGIYNFTIAQTMRESPLPNVMSIGLRVEKAK